MAEKEIKAYCVKLKVKHRTKAYVKYPGYISGVVLAANQTLAKSKAMGFVGRARTHFKDEVEITVAKVERLRDDFIVV